MPPSKGIKIKDNVLETSRNLVINFCVKSNYFLLLSIEANPGILLEALTHDVTYYENQIVVPTCNHFNASLPKQEKFVITCRPDEKGCLKGWLTQVKFKALKYRESPLTAVLIIEDFAILRL